MSRKLKRAAGSRTTIDVMRHLTNWSLEDRKSVDLEAVRNGDARLVRCYVKPDIGEDRRQWKPGYIEVTKDRLVWQGSSKKWPPFTMLAGQWATRTRNVYPDERVYKSWRVIECNRGLENHSFAVPKLDAGLCMSALA